MNGKGDKQRPTDLKKYRNNYDTIFSKEKENKMDFHVATKGTKEDEKPIALVDIDETICFYSGDRRYDLAEPSKENIAKINKMYDQGWQIVYWTARGSVSKKDYYQYTWDQLKSWGCKFHDLCTGTGGPHQKPNYDLIIDDKAKRIEEI